MNERAPLSPALVERLSDLLAAAIVKQVRARQREEDQREPAAEVAAR